MSSQDKYNRVRKKAQARSAALVASGQEIGPLPPVRDPRRRAAADASFRVFCESYFPRLFTLEWSGDHLRVIAKIETAVTVGGQFAVAMPRGFGKTTLCQVAALWAILTGRHQFVFLISATAEFATAALANLKSHLSSNELLLEDYPDAVFPIHHLEGESRRCSGQRHYGHLTHIGLLADQLILPTIQGSHSSGALVRTSGILGNYRGSMHIRPDGTSVRPSLVIVDDPQTDQSARSFLQVHERLSVINGAILGLAGPGKAISVVVPCTVIQSGDMADQLLDRTLHPEWHGERTKLVYGFPTADKLWHEYARLRAESLRADGDGSPATEFYRHHRDAMDAGASVAWHARFNPGEISAIQHAMNLKLRDEAAFFAEYQNEPLQPATDATAEGVSAAEIKLRINLVPRGVVPVAVQHVTAAIDVHDEILYWLAAGWADGFSGWVLDYGAFPDQRRPFWTHEKVPHPLSRLYPGHGPEAAIRQGLLDLAAQLCTRVWPRQDGGEMRIERMLVDSGYRPDQVRDACRNSPHTAVLLPYRGFGITAAKKPMSEYTRRPGDRLGWHWYIPPPLKGVRVFQVDTNFWKSFLQARWRTAVGDPGSVSLFGDDPQTHEMLAAHLAAEIPVRVTANGRSVEEWRSRPGTSANHWLDGLVMNAAAASLCGVMLPGSTDARPAPKPKLRLSDLQKGR